MLRTAVVVLLSASPALAQDSAANALAFAGCGANEVHFDVKTARSSTQPRNPMPARHWHT
jgi:hypothetical protein